MSIKLSPDPSHDHLSTGIDVLDERLGGGLRPGSLLLLSAPPTSQSEVFLAELSKPRPTLYITTQRTASSVRESLELGEVDSDHCRVVSIDHTDPMPINQAYQHVEQLGNDSTLVIDAFNPLEADEAQRLQTFLNGVKARLETTNSLGVLHAFTGQEVPSNRDLTSYMADVVFDLETDVRGEFVENHLFVPKVRNGSPIPEVVKVGLSDGVSVDTSRDIA